MWQFFQFVYIIQLFVYIFLKKLPPLKHILGLPIWGQKCILSELQPFEVATFDLGHPVKYVSFFSYDLFSQFSVFLIPFFLFHTLDPLLKMRVSVEIKAPPLKCHLKL